MRQNSRMANREADARIRVGLVEDDFDFQRALVGAIAASSDMALAYAASTRAEGLRAVQNMEADVLLVDLGLPDGSGIDVIAGAQARWPGCAVMVSTAFGDELHVIRSIEAGAAGYLLKDSTPAQLLDEIRSLHAGGSPISPLIARQILARFRMPLAVAPAVAPATAPVADREDEELSAREREVLNLITKGFTAAEIAQFIGVSQHTVLTYVRRIYRKLRVNSKAEAIYEARQRGILGA
jgi:DNA-binding NarL/FixJ family response regulator